MPIPQETLDQLILLIQEEGKFVFCDEEDANFFRNLEKRKKKTPAPEIIRQPESKPAFQPPPPAKVELKIEASLPVKEPPLKTVRSEIKAAAPLFDFSPIRNILSKVAPELAIFDQIPSDDLAKKISEKWKTKNQIAPISILCYQEPEEQKVLLQNIAHAVDLYFGPAKIISADKVEKNDQWDTFLSSEELKLVIVCDYTLWQLKSLMKLYRETPNTGLRILKNTPLFLLPDLSLYLKDSSLKRSLWKALCQRLS